MVDGKDLYKHLTTMLNLTDELEEVTRTNAMDKDFMRTICFSIMGMLRYSNIIEIIINGPVLQKANLINKQAMIEH